ncbi:hypothetical protein Xen7305DRAFT_00048900 [Xenococcus sp. PCC 7305]|uniref:hypothetical protein n=1 Tax=Xenococcus sp. PCC 7305 TaxID=102125 RepID=UPI0002ABF660|nr:hypothetical protein [Xenococcus sp. PCC 7305]ELS05148.1 hypothetical protein Xen7305DRAFT_00048900 [Xenococcus sp. PCC 7305]
MSVDLIPLSQLPSRYGIARSNLYTRLKELKIESVKQGRKAFVTAASLQLLDGLHAHLEQGGTTSDFIKLQANNIVTIPNSSLESSNYFENPYSSEPTISLNPTALVGVIETVVKRLIPTSRSRLTYMRELEEAYQNQWLLSTSEVSDLLGLTKKTITNYGQEFSDAGFIFERVGVRKGGEIAWSIDKESNRLGAFSDSTEQVKAAFSEAFDP